MRISSPVKTFGNSMYPLLHDGDVVYFKKKMFSKIGVNDIVCVKKNGKIFVHRVIYRKTSYLITKGDSSQLNDGKIFKKNYLGTIFKIRRDTFELGIEDLYLFQSTTYLNEIIKVKNLLEKHGLDVIFLKGLPLYLYFNGKHPRRIYADCDVLISRESFSKARRVLSQLGYVYIDTSIWGNKRTIEKRAEVSFSKKINNFVVVFDIHFELIHLIDQVGPIEELYSGNLSQRLTQKFINEKIPVKIMGENFYILKPENLFIFLLFHLFRHNFKGTYRYDFLSLILGKKKIDYAEVICKLRDYKLINFVFPSIEILRLKYDVKFPKFFLEEINNRNYIVSVLHSRFISASIFNENIRLESGAGKFRNVILLADASLYRKIFMFLKPEIIMSMLNYYLFRIKILRDNFF